ncbi:MAG: hypothetical protein ACQET5_02795 [Halobacteriota archaeon]|uniref:hypothetical protein n=1 Tax=Natronomonas sp. TaxID=2184060 RepID=UPI003976969F
MANEDLHKPLKAINQTLANVRTRVEELIGEVQKVKTAITDSAEMIRDAIHENIQAQAELKLMEHVMDVRSVKPQIEAEHEQIVSERDELDERVESIAERYERKQAELDEKAEERIRDVGEHIFEIDEEQFEAGIEDPFTQQVTGAWEVLQAHNDEVREERTERLRGTTGDVVQSIYDYIDRQEQLVETIQDHRLDDVPLPTDSDTQLQVPYYVVEYEIDGVSERQIVVPSRLTSNGGEWCSVSLSPIDGTEDLMSGVHSTISGVEEGRLTDADLREALESHGESSLGLSYTDAVSDAVLEEGVTVAVEGGSD